MQWHLLVLSRYTVLPFIHSFCWYSVFLFDDGILFILLVRGQGSNSEKTREAGSLAVWLCNAGISIVLLAAGVIFIVYSALIVNALYSMYLLACNVSMYSVPDVVSVTKCLVVVCQCPYSIDILIFLLCISCCILEISACVLLSMASILKYKYNDISLFYYHFPRALIFLHILLFYQYFLLLRASMEIYWLLLFTFLMTVDTTWLHSGKLSPATDGITVLHYIPPLLTFSVAATGTAMLKSVVWPWPFCLMTEADSFWAVLLTVLPVTVLFYIQALPLEATLWAQEVMFYFCSF